MLEVQKTGLAGNWLKVEEIITAEQLHDLNKIGDIAGDPYYLPNILKSGNRSDAIPYMVKVGLFPVRHIGKC